MEYIILLIYCILFALWVHKFSVVKTHIRDFIFIRDFVKISIYNGITYEILFRVLNFSSWLTNNLENDAPST
jgi:hypothetical protein